MLKQLKKFICFAFVVGSFALSASTAQALVCPQPEQVLGTAWCNTDDSNFTEGTLCIVEPIAGNFPNNIDQEVAGAGICILGKFKELTDLESLVDLVVAYDFSDDPQGPSGVEVPNLEVLASSGEFIATLPLPEAGVYDIAVRLRLLEEGGSLKDIPISRRVLRAGLPHLTVTKAKVGNSAVDCDGDTEESDHADEATDCLGVTDTTQPGSGGGGTDPTHTVKLDSPQGEAASARSIELCLESHNDEPNAGSQLTILASNLITDDSVSPVRELTVQATCALGELGGKSVCQQFSDS